MKVVLTFYRNLALVTIAISLFGSFLWVKSGSPYFIVTVFWMKIMTNILIGGYIHLFRSDQYNFYYNLGFSLRRLYGSIFILDFLLWIIISFGTSFFL